MSNKKQLSIIMLLTTKKTTIREEVNRFKKILIVLTFFYSVKSVQGNTSSNNAAGACLPSGSSRTEQNSSCSPQHEPRIYLITRGWGLKTYSLDTSSVVTIVNDTGYTEGPIAYDPMNDKIYYGKSTRMIGGGTSIFRANADGSDVKAVYNVQRSWNYGRLMGVAFDWITGNLYGLTLKGSVFVCKEVEASGLLCCMGLVKHEGLFQQIVLSPVQGTMYWTNTDSGMQNASIWRAEMDGSNPRAIIKGRYYPQSLAIDFVESRLYWSGVTTLKIQSSNLDGSDVRTIFQDSAMDARLGHFRIAVYKDRIYWRNWNWSPDPDLKPMRTIRSSTKTGQDISIVYNSTDAAIAYLAIGPPELPCHSRPNHCKDSNCSTICVLTRTASRCLQLRPVVSNDPGDNYSCSL